MAGCICFGGRSKKQMRNQIARGGDKGGRIFRPPRGYGGGTTGAGMGAGNGNLTVLTDDGGVALAATVAAAAVADSGECGGSCGGGECGGGGCGGGCGG